MVIKKKWHIVRVLFSIIVFYLHISGMHDKQILSLENGKKLWQFGCYDVKKISLKHELFDDDEINKDSWYLHVSKKGDSLLLEGDRKFWGPFSTETSTQFPRSNFICADTSMCLAKTGSVVTLYRNNFDKVEVIENFEKRFDLIYEESTCVGTDHLMITSVLDNDKNRHLYLFAVEPFEFIADLGKFGHDAVRYSINTKGSVVAFATAPGTITVCTLLHIFKPYKNNIWLRDIRCHFS